MKNSNLKILFEDNEILAFDKPAFLVVNKSESQKDKVTLEGILEEGREKYGLNEDVERFGIVHRLDKETSGVILVAKNYLMQKRLQKEFEKRRVRKTYLAIVNGEVRDETFSIDAPIGRNPNNTMKHAVVKEGREAQTSFKKVKEITLDGNVYTLLEARPKTGRTHQIRVHLLAYGHPVVCDPMYLGRRTYAENIKTFPRLMLHAQSIEFTHPTTKETILIKSTPPKEFKI